MENFIIKTTPPSNPWNGIRLSDLTVANCDKSIITALPTDVLSEIEVRTLPEPYHGNHDANVYLLGGNPMAGDDDLRYAQMDNPVDGYRNRYEKELCEELLGVNKDFIWLRDQETVVDQNGNPYPAYKWWKQRLNALRQSLPQRLQCLLPSLVFAVEYFPYHTKNQKNIASIPPLKSDDYADSLIYDAMNSGKIIVVMRCLQKWLSRIKGLRSYPNLIMLHNPQSVYLSRGNMRPQDWAKLTDRINIDAVRLAINRGII